MSSTKARVSISPLLLKLANPSTTLSSITAAEIAAAIAHIFDDAISDVQTGCLLYALHTTQLDRRPDVLAACGSSMRAVATQVDVPELTRAVKQRGRPQGSYKGGLCDIVGTGGDGHNTYNVSTTSSIVASPLVLIAKHGNNASTSTSGSADLLLNCNPSPVIASTTATTIASIYTQTNYAFLYAREWHPGMRHAAAVRKEVPFRTLFNSLGPLANPIHNTSLIEARIVGVAKQDMGPVFADALKLSGARNALVVCGQEDLDEVSCAGPTQCWLLRPSGSEAVWTNFTISPEDFGLERHPLSSVAGGKSPAENARILERLLADELEVGDPVLDFVLINTAALLTVAGVCEDDTSSMGDGDDGKVITERGPGGLRWKEGVRRARWCIRSGAARREWDGFVKATREIAEEQ